MTAFKLHNVKDSVFTEQGVIHGFYGRTGGVSGHIFKSLNCGLGSSDSKSDVQENRARLMKDVGGAGMPLLTLSQIHSAKCLIVDQPFPEDKPLPEADAMVTKTPGLMLGIGTADCAPVLYAGEDAQGNRIVGAAHSGSMGALKGVNGSVIDAMCLLGAHKDTIRAVIGPCIRQESYEVGPEVFDKFTADKKENEIFFAQSKNRAGHYMFNLPDYVEKRIKDAGVKDVSAQLCEDTYTEENHYFSYRRSCHRKEPDYGRQLSVIGIKD